MATRLTRLVTVVSALTLLGCTDRATLTAPPSTGPVKELSEAPDGLPYVDDPSEIPADFHVHIWEHRPRVSFNGADAEGYTLAKFRGNHGEVYQNLIVMYDNRATSVQSTVPVKSYRPQDWLIGQPIKLETNGTCGHAATLNSKVVTELVLWIKTALTTWESLPSDLWISASQSGCQTENGDGESSGGGSGGGGGGAEGGGGGWCAIEYWYDIQTGDVLGADVLFCVT